jgi:outer membrane lipoprotein SlyB
VCTKSIAAPTRHINQYTCRTDYFGGKLAWLLHEQWRNRKLDSYLNEEMTMWTYKVSAPLAGLILLSVVSCGSVGGSSTTATGSTGITGTSVAGAPASSGYGVVQSIELVDRQNAGIGLGTLAGAAVGGVLGNQVGKGRGNTAATVAGAAGGAVVGHQMEKNMRQDEQAYRVTVRTDNGSLQPFVYETHPNVQIGDRVRIAGNVLERY